MFTLREHTIKVEQKFIKMKKVAHIAIENLKANAGIEGFYIEEATNMFDGKLELTLNNKKEKFLAVVKHEIRNYQIEQIIDWAKNNKNFIVIAENIFPKIKAALRNNGVCYLDMAGNIYLHTKENHIWIEGNKKVKPVEKTNRAFTATGLKAIYLFLTEKEFLNQSQRKIAEKAGIALGNINIILKGLKEHGFLIEKVKKEFQLINKKELLEKWAIAFDEKLKPGLYIGNFRYAKADEEKNWNQIPFKPKQTFWGGEAAGAIITQYLMPEIFTVYTDETINNLIKDYRLVPDPAGPIKVYAKFWKNGITYNDNAVHPLLAYTDLINSGNSRCIETAKIILEKNINEFI